MQYKAHVKTASLIVKVKHHCEHCFVWILKSKVILFQYLYSHFDQKKQTNMTAQVEIAWHKQVMSKAKVILKMPQRNSDLMH